MKNYSIFEVIREDYKPVAPLVTTSLDTGKDIPTKIDLDNLLKSSVEEVEDE